MENTMMQFATSSAAHSTIGETGIATLLDNKPSTMFFTATTWCYDGSGMVTAGQFVSGTDTFYPNLQPAYGDLDLGNVYGAMFTPTSITGTFS
eukprot:7870506-Pyramimonas_sp.AAC.1